MLEKYSKEIEQFFSAVASESSDAESPSRKQFTRLLASPTTVRKVPGIPCRMNENEDYHCNNEESQTVRSFLKQLYNIDSKDSLLEFQRPQFQNSVQYEQFMTFWKKAPLFDLKELNPDGRKGFDRQMSFAQPFYPLLEEKGLYAWDISEYIGICRACLACGIINESEFDEIVDRFVRKAQVFYHSFKEYAMSYLCGAMFYMASNGSDANGLDQFFDIQKRVLSMLFEKNGDWTYYKWYKPTEREWAPIYPNNLGCIITKAALEKGIGYMYREEGIPDRPDSGWRFFSGDESDEYVNDPQNSEIVGLNTVCNIQPNILAFTEAPANSAYGWNGKDWEPEKLK